MILQAILAILFAYLTAVSQGDSSGGTTKDSPSLTVSGTQKVLYVLAANSDGSPLAPSGCVWDAAGVNQALSQIGTAINYGTFFETSLWRRIAPSDATSVVTCTWAATQGERMVLAWVETGLDQTTPNVDPPTQTFDDTSPPTTVSAGAVSTPSGAGQRVIMFGHSGNIGPISITFDSPTGTERTESQTTPSSFDAVAAQDQTSAGASVTPTWTLSSGSGSGWSTYVVVLNVAGAGPSCTPNNFMLLAAGRSC